MELTLTRISVMMFIFVTIFAVSSLSAQEKRIKEKDLPAAVTKAFHTEYSGAKIVGTSTEVEKGVSYFEIESMDGKVRRDLLYTKEGKIAEIEEVLNAETIPVAVKESIKKKFKKVEFKKGEKNIRGAKTIYEVVIEANEVKYEVVCDAQGKITKTRKIKNKESDEKDND